MAKDWRIYLDPSRPSTRLERWEEREYTRSRAERARDEMPEEAYEALLQEALKDA